MTFSNYIKSSSLTSHASSSTLSPRWGIADAEIKGSPWWEPRAIIASLFLSLYLVRVYIALRAVSAYLPNFCLPVPDSFNFIFSKFLQSSTVECVLNSESKIILVVGIHFVSPWYDPSRLTGRKTSSIYVSSKLSLTNINFVALWAMMTMGIAPFKVLRKLV